MKSKESLTRMSCWLIIIFNIIIDFFQKMVLHLVCLLVFLLFSATTSGAQEEQAVTVDLTAIGPQQLQETYTVVLQCIINGSFDENRDKIVLQKAGKELITLADQNNLTSSAPSNFGLIYTPAEGAHTLFVTIHNIKRQDRGDYICKVLRPKNDNEYETVAEKMYSVNVSYTPNSKPSCEILPPQPSYHEGDKITFRCTADVGYPAVPVQFVNEQGIDEAIIPFEDRKSYKQYGNTVLELPVTLTSNMNGIRFDCIRGHNGNISSNHTCSFGPLEIFNETSHINAVDPEESPSDGIPMHVIGPAIGGIIAVLIVIIIVVVVKKRQTGPGGKSKKRREISGPVKNIEYDKVSTVENGDGKPLKVAASSDSPEYAMIEKPKKKTNSKKYPDPPDYPRPTEPKPSKVSPYANAEINPGSKSNDGKPKPKVYANTLDVGSDDAYKKPESTKEPRSKKDEPEIYDYPEQTLTPPPPPDETSRNPWIYWNRRQ